jgi:hypothetical protein
VAVEQPSVAQTVSILRGLRPRYEQYHGLGISEGALLAAATLSHRYINSRCGAGAGAARRAVDLPGLLAAALAAGCA